MPEGSLIALKQVVVADVVARTPVNERERIAIEQFVAEIGRLKAPFSEHADPTHVTASAVVVGPRGIVLHRHKILGTWVAPGGHIDPGETPWDAARREAAEETGLTVDHVGGVPTLVHIDPGETPWDAARREAAEETGLTVDHVGGVPTLVHVDVHQGPRGHTHLDLRYLLDGGDTDPAPPPDESQEVAWFSWHEAITITEPCMEGIVRHLASAR